jgi:hypothetical protein
MISRAIYETLNVIPEYISSYDARCYGFPELMAVRTINRKGEAYTEKEMAKKTPVLFGAYDIEADKKVIVWEKVADMEPQITWLFDKKGKLKKENYDMSDSLVCVIGKQRMDGLWD